MDPVIVFLAVFALLLFSGWGYGYYSAGPAVHPQMGPALARPRRVHLLGAIGLFMAAVLALLLLTGWRPVW
jgi:hypothetical protein